MSAGRRGTSTRAGSGKRHLAHTEDLEDVTWIVADGLRYARPEVSLLFEASQIREKDRLDADAALPRPDDRARRWLRDVVARMDPGHPWAATL